MPATDNHGSSVSLSNYGRSIFSLRRDQVDGGSQGHDGSSTSSGGHDADLEAFQKLVSDRFADLAAAPAEELLTLAWVRKLLEAFLCCQEEFRVVLSSHRAQFSRPPTDRLVADFYERTVKALDVCNAIRDGIEQIRQWQKLLEIVICALDNNKNQKNLGEGQFRRAKKALIDLAIGMLDEKDSAHQQLLAHRNRSFGRKDSKSLCHFRSLSWSVSRSWSAARQLQAIGNNLAAPKGNDINGLSVPIFTMGSVLLFVMWVLVAAIPCQDRGLQVHFNIPRQFAWATPLHSLHDRILEEYKKRDRRNSCGLLREIHQIEKCSRLVNELGDSASFPLPDEKVGEVMQRVQELAQVSALIKEGLDPLERQVREAFHRIVLSRTEGLDSIGRVNTN